MTFSLRALFATAAFCIMAPALAQDAPAEIRFGDVGFGLGAPFGQGIQAVADAKGFIAKEFEGKPTRLTFTYFTGTGPAINEALSNNQLDFASYGSVPAVIGRANGLQNRVLISYGGTNFFAGARPDLPINSIADLKGKRITVQKATIIHWGLIRALNGSGLSEKDVTIVDLKNADQVGALASRSVDAIFGASYVLPLQEKGIARFFYNSTELGPRGAGFGAVFVTDAFATKYPAQTEAVVRGLLRAADFIAKDENREDVFQIWSRTGTPVELFRKEYEGISLKDAYNPLLDEFFTARFLSVIGFNKEQKLTRAEVDLAKWVDRSFIDTALKATGLEAAWPQRSTVGAKIN